ncbi:MAG: DUF4142 domain-containing protein [Pirellula sp.]
MKINKFAIAMSVVLSAANSLLAQPASNPPADESTSRQQSPNAEQTKDQTFAKCLIISNQEQVLLSRYVKDKLSNEEVKQFAILLEKDHQACLEKLNGLSAATGTNNSIKVRPVSTATANKSTNVDFLELQQEIATQCLKDTQEYLGQKKGTDFDRCVVALQIAKHAGMKSTLTVLQRHTTGKVQGVIKEGLDMNSQHMQSAVELMEQLASQDSSVTTQAPK